MNKELIRDLAITGGIYDCICDPYDKLKNGDHYSSVMVDLERFAEKIVRECANEILKWKSEPFPYDPEFGAKLIKEHFGIKE
jgi:hypothetical protein